MFSGINNPFTEESKTTSPVDTSNPFFSDLQAAAIASAVARGANPFSEVPSQTAETGKIIMVIIMPKGLHFVI